MRIPRLLSGLALLAAVVGVQPVGATPAVVTGDVETVRVAPGGSVKIVVTRAACGTGKTVLVSGRPIGSAVRRNGLGILRVKAVDGRIRVSFVVPAATDPGRYPVTMRCLRSPTDPVGTLIPGARAIVVVTG